MKLRQVFHTPLVQLMAPLSMMALLGTTGGIWLMADRLIPQAAYAYTNTVTINLDWGPDEQYETLLRRAEIAARAAAQRSFDSDILMTDVVVNIIGESEGTAVPILLLEVSRDDWRRAPDPERWATYFRTSKDLLMLSRPAASDETQPDASPTPAAATSPTQNGPAIAPVPTDSVEQPEQVGEPQSPPEATP